MKSSDRTRAFTLYEYTPAEGGTEELAPILSVLNDAQKEIRTSARQGGTGTVLLLPADEETLRTAGKAELYHQSAASKDPGSAVSLQTEQYVGFLYSEKENCVLRICSRFDEEKTQPFFSDYILSKVLKDDSYLFRDRTFSEGERVPVDWLLAVIFVSKLDRAYKKGSFRQYRSYENNDSRVRGRIDAARHLRENPRFNGRIAYSYRDYTEDNDINRLILTTCTLLEKRYPWFRRLLFSQNNRNAKAFVEQIRMRLQPASRTELRALMQHCSRRITHPMYQEWEIVRQLALAILRHAGNLGDLPRGNLITGILVDMNRAWEVYLEQIFRTYVQPEAYSLRTQAKERILYGKEQPFGQREIIPDFAWKKIPEQSYALILDAKNKTVWGELAEDPAKSWSTDPSEEHTPIRTDLFQILSYMYSLNAPKGGIVCPMKDEAKQPCGPYQIKPALNENRFYLFGLAVGAGRIQSFGAYLKEMEGREKAFGKAIRNVLELDT